MKEWVMEKVKRLYAGSCIHDFTRIGDLGNANEKVL